MKTLNKLSVLLSALLIIPVIVSGQIASDYTVDENSTVLLEGTSTLHDWEANVEDFSLQTDLDPESLKAGEVSVTNLTFSAVVESIESGKGKMNGKIYDALKEKDHPEITFKMTDASLKDSDSDRINLEVTGDLTVAGTTNKITFPVEGMQIAADAYRFDGSYSLEMQDYNVKRPSAMLGTIKAGEEVDISFSIILSSDSEVTANR